MSTIFISHSTKNNAFTEWLARGLRAEGFDVWVDLDSIRDGERWLRAIQDAIEACESVIVVLSKAARDSEWVEREALLAMDLAKRLYIALIEDVPLPLHLINRQFTDFRDDSEKARQESLQRVVLALGSTPPVRFPKSLNPKPDKENFFAYLDQLPGKENALVARDLYRWAQTEADHVEFGGKVTPGFHARVHLSENEAVTVFSLWAYRRNPAVQVQFQYLRSYSPYTDDSLRRSTLHSLNRILPDDPLHDDQADRRPTIELDALNTADKLEQFKQIMREIINNLHGN